MERTTSPPTHSKPVDISPRSLAKTSTQIQTVRVRGQNGSRSTRVSKNHRSDAIPPAVAALLAVTSIPPMPNRRRKVPATDRRISMDELIQEWKQDDLDLPPSVVGSPLDLLLGRVEEFDEDEYGSPKSMEQEKDYMTSRSISSESISTIPPSLDLDAPSFASNWDNISTPESYRSERREKVVQSPETEDCVLDHPLLHFNQDDCDDITRVEIADIIASAPASTDRFRSFKSNLTASLQALKSAAKSFSNFTAPSVPPDDLLTRSLLSPRFTSEMRPKLMEGTPSPALRRYLNPQPSSISPTELSMQLHKSLSIDIDIDESTPMIQMQTYDRRGRSVNRKKRGTDQYSEAGRGLSSAPAVRQREPRENSDFLRVIVLEMNMRRVGKLDARAVGRARIWLPPRKLESSKQPPSVQSTSGVPDRWIGLQLADSD
ncbi:hypothetical protein BU24DRAFT_466166 [Aaosphaeria arxii CBS 175.79]|uniref:Uncharacterized protein n=1 Tax=Aaosphaeria arxii CBS 175.79 TaxID=1450172 RepID=A0A6A5XF19_9PLEO|nr:uncharacterized protein BU24DRAFT_466166 [Aaosphaeria arxii CBS 175.79]KAF2011459.1 hypothetical protein BU24DRAFT_466166 [Aaosphaeria arxii CBS 175.79]